MLRITVFQESVVPCFVMQAEHIARLRTAFPEAVVKWCRSEIGFIRALPQTDVAITWAFRQEWFARAPRLRYILSNAAGRDFRKIDQPPNVTVRYGTFHGPLMAETVLGMMLGVNRGLFTALRGQIAGDLWHQPPLYGNMHLLRGTHAVILGFGHIGQTIGAYLKPLGVRVTGLRRTRLKKRPKWFTTGDRALTMRTLDRVVAEADHLIMVLPSDTGTDNLMDAQRLALLPQHAVIYNVGRGNSIDEAALAAALKSGALRGACLDVFKCEPLKDDSPLSEDLPGLLRLPHASAFAEPYLDRFLDEVIPWLKKRV